jgi:CHAT domain-containing protein/tetratricopeptide (TPR) repeat protein
LDYCRAAYDEAERRFQAALNLARSSGRATQVPGLLNNLGLVRYARGRYAEAIELYQAAYDEHVNAGDTAAAAESLGNIASVYMSWAHWPEAEDAYGRALAAFEQLGDAASAENTRINLGLLHSAQGSYVQARAELEEAITRAAARGLRQSEAYALAGLGAVYYATGLYDLAENAFRRALDIDKALDIQLNVVSVSTSLGRLYQAWGRYDQALDLYRSSLEAAQRLGVPDQELAALHLIGSVHAAQGRYDIALEQYDKALAMAELSGNPASKLPVLDSLGSAHFQLRSFEKAESYYRAALDLAQRLGLKDMEGREMIHLGGVNQVSGNRQNALLLYNAAVQACHAAGSKADEATALNNLGTLFIDMRSWDRAEAPLLQAIAIKEQLRATALGRDRMDFLASQVSSYRWLVAERARRGDAAAAFDASELMKARWLSEQLGGGAENPGFAGIRAIQGSLGVGSLVLDYANIDAEMPVLLSASRDAVRARDLSLQGAELPGGAASRAVAAEQPASRGFAIVRTAPRPSGFSDIVAAYRSLLAIARPSTEERAERDRLAHRLYDLLLGPAEKELEGKEELLVVPEGSLCALPFETLRMPDGRYLVERFHVIYVPSLTVKGQLERRRGAAGPAAGTPGAPRPLLALGGALYGGAPSRAARSVSDQQLTSLRLDAQRLGEQHRGMRELYAALGLDAWEELPGTLAEVSSIGRLMPGGTVLTGAQASEQRIKQLSLSGELMRYGVIHFATHGMAVPEAPELSALVLSLKDGEGAEDGFLTAGEIADLKLAADFVNLSACETGLGRILSGEGIVGLSQAFLSAGSNGLSVSLWPVADDATRQFMTELYRLVGEKGLSFARAMTEVKRRFIREGAWQEPLYWAPFVYYGVDTGGQAKER